MYSLVHCVVENTNHEHRWGSDVIAVKVGKGKNMKMFTVYEDTIRARSPFFDNAMSGEWKGKQERTVPLPDTEPAAFVLYMDFIHSDCIYLGEDGLSEDRALVFGPPYVLGDMLLDHDFKDAVVDNPSCQSQRLLSIRAESLCL